MPFFVLVAQPYFKSYVQFWVLDLKKDNAELIEVQQEWMWGYGKMLVKREVELIGAYRLGMWLLQFKVMLKLPLILIEQQQWLNQSKVTQ